ncbi:uncharacterized protein LTR77_004774 [Saxophila tyrrhenica]|uniref:SGF29 C-terminal domain-containing protein n=1 Tax=Saxophila tyrrhenica TaxID=1690608 RepID=A0AAV9PAU8_9PEZI|nr:hypothetical protein LTR77_004774 [Saxophila tyrrhenica]
MSVRNRARGNVSNDDDDQMRRLWENIKEKSRDVARQEARSNELGYEIIEVEDQQAQAVASDKPPSTALDERLEKLYREKIKLSEEIQNIVQGNPEGMNLLDSIKVLAALRETSESSAAQSLPTNPPPQRNASSKLSRPNKRTASGKPTSASTITTSLAPDDMDLDTPAAPSPKIHLNPGSRLSKNQPSRAASVSATREASVKLEDGAESVASSTDGIASSTGAVAGSKTSLGGSSRTTNRLVLTKGEVVFCRHSHIIPTGPDATEGEGILCRVTAVIGEGKQRRYEVQDADTQGEPPPPQRASVSQLIQIPPQNSGLPELAKGRNVLAQYPDTTTFYRAEVVEAWRGGPGEEVKLKFEDDEVPRPVERRFVLTEK